MECLVSIYFHLPKKREKDISGCLSMSEFLETIEIHTKKSLRHEIIAILRHNGPLNVDIFKYNFRP
jgi:hypothetical protein